MAYIALADVKTYGDWASSDDDTLLGALITRAQQTIDTFTGRTFECTSDDSAAHYLNSVDDVDGRYLYVGDDLNTIDSITVGTDTIPSTDYAYQPRNVKPIYRLRMLSHSPYAWSDYATDPDDNIVITGQWAYSSSAPVDIQHACLRLVKWMYNQRTSGADVDRPVLDPTGVMIMPMDLPADVFKLLMPYRKQMVMG